MGSLSSDLKALFQKSGNRCAFPGCGKLLSAQEGQEETVILSNVAHIVAQSSDGPRGNFALPMNMRDLESNLILLCPEHHKLIDDQPQRYTVERLRGFKEDHEKTIQKATGNVLVKNKETDIGYKKEIVYSSLFEVLKLPVYVYKSKILPDEYQMGSFDELPTVIPPDIFLPYTIENDILWSFQNPSDQDSPFHNLVDKTCIQTISSREMWKDPIKQRWFVELLNKSMNIFMKQKGFGWDDIHHRYYFTPQEDGNEKKVTYRPLNQKTSEKQVAWRPITKKTDLPKKYWLHRAISMRFLHVSSNQWCLSLRPEFRVTKDGFIPIISEKIGAKITRKKSRMFNYDLMGEINFWRSYLSDNEPRIILKFGDSYLNISSNLLTGEILWPGIAEKYEKSFTNVEYADDLFTWAKLQELGDMDNENLEEDLDVADEGSDFDE